MSDRRHRLVFFSTDRGFLVPTIVAAEQITRQADVMAIADVMIMLIDIAPEQGAALQAAFPKIAFRHISKDGFALPDGAVFNETHVPKAALARLSSSRYIDSQYKHIVYIDGDVQIVGSILPLVSHDVGEGHILAGPDAAEMWWSEAGGSATGERHYVRGLGISDPRLYFNSGVLAATRETWAAFGVQALQFMRDRSAICRYHDQSALNAITPRAKREFLSPRYNFNRWYGLLGLRERMNPAIIHFTGAQKPWADKYPSYNGEFKDAYTTLVARHPVLAPYWETTSGRAGPGLDQPPRLGLGWALPWRVPLRRKRALRSFRRTPYSVA
ncbi:glycosyltransferase family 8 protein [Sphingomonas kyungheensis]|uniref:Glycosyltransferase n=1 Tax=Sphingomonas kyungheensis TaxID=1069987 RepID=A0ABU8H487_9SPHN